MGELLRKLLAYTPSSSQSSYQDSSHQNGPMPSYPNQQYPNHGQQYENHDQQYQNNSQQYQYHDHQNQNQYQQYQNDMQSHPNQLQQNQMHQIHLHPQPNLGSPPQQGPRTLIFKKSVIDTYTDIITIYLPNSPSNSPPVYTIKSDIASKPTITFFHGNQEARNILGTSTIHSVSSKQDLVWRGQAMKMKTSSLSGNSTLDFAGFGKLKWIVSKLGGSSLELRDEAGISIAKYDSVSFMGDKKLEIFVPGDEGFVGLVVLSAMTCVALSKMERKVLSSVAGAA